MTATPLGKRSHRRAGHRKASRQGGDVPRGIERASSPDAVAFSRELRRPEAEQVDSDGCSSCARAGGRQARRNGIRSRSSATARLTRASRADRRRRSVDAGNTRSPDCRCQLGGGGTSGRRVPLFRRSPQGGARRRAACCRRWTYLARPMHRNPTLVSPGGGSGLELPAVQPVH